MSECVTEGGSERGSEWLKCTMDEAKQKYKISIRYGCGWRETGGTDQSRMRETAQVYDTTIDLKPCETQTCFRQNTQTAKLKQRAVAPFNLCPVIFC